MRFSYLFTGFLLILSVFTSTSCHKASENGPTVSITTPAVDEQIANELPVKLTGNVSDADGLHSLTIKITDDKSGVVLFTKSPNVLNLKSYAFSESWTPKVTDWVDATVTVVAENHGAKQTTQTVKIKIWL
jgi:hypothetical protein